MGTVERLSAHEVEIVRQCLAAAVEGPFFPDWEFAALIGLDRDGVAAVLAAWPARDDADTQQFAVSNVLNNLLGYPHHQWEAWPQYITATPADVAAVLARWRGDEHFDSAARGYFDRLR
jgi:hypothetical protein